MSFPSPTKQCLPPSRSILDLGDLLLLLFCSRHVVGCLRFGLADSLILTFLDSQPCVVVFLKCISTEAGRTELRFGRPDVLFRQTLRHGATNHLLR